MSEGGELTSGFVELSPEHGEAGRERAARLQLEKAAVLADLGELEMEVRAYRSDVKALRERVAGLETELAGVYASRSWRITSPLRLASRALGGLLERGPPVARDGGGTASETGSARPASSPKGPDSSASELRSLAAREAGTLKSLALSGVHDLCQEKVNLVAGCVGTKSLRDFGGLWAVYGRYLLEPAVSLKAEFASMVDVTPRAEFDEAVRLAKQQNSRLEVEFINDDFRDPGLYAGLRPVDTSILFDVLLHQENYVNVLREISQKTKRFICVAQPCLKESEFFLPSSAALLQFWPEALKDKYREASLWPKEPKVARFTTGYWMWGHSVSHLMDCLYGLGWTLQSGGEIAGIVGPRWDYALLRFVRS